MDKVELTTNWQYKGCRIYQDPDHKFYICLTHGIYPINFSGLPKTIQYGADGELKNYTIHGKIGRDQE